jgi:hypothetical protein
MVSKLKATLLDLKMMAEACGMMDDSNSSETRNEAVSENILSMQNEAKHGAGKSFFKQNHPTPLSCTDYNHSIAQDFPDLLRVSTVLLFDNMFHSHGSHSGCLAEVPGGYQNCPDHPLLKDE